MIGWIKERLITGGKPKISRAQVLGARPARNPAVAWTREKPRRGQAADDDPAAEPPAVVVLRVPRRKDRIGNVVAKVFRLPDFRKIELDEIGSDVWEMCDGTRDVEALTKAVCAKYRLNRRQGEASVTAYLRMLAERRLVALKSGGGVAAAGRSGGNGKAAVKGRGAKGSVPRRRKQA
jgi:hypothetical protein